MEIKKERIKEYIDDIAIYMTELKYNEFCYKSDGSFQDDAQTFYEETFDEQETLLKTMLGIFINENG